MSDDIVTRLAEWQKPILRAVVNGKYAPMSGEELRANDRRRQKAWLRHWYEQEVRGG